MAIHPRTAEEAMNVFRASSEAGCWSQLSKATLLKQINDRVEDEYSVNQAGTLLCGPASLIFALLVQDKTRYVQICQALFERGSFGKPFTASKIYSASEKLRALAPDPDIPQVDWMLAMTLREGENTLLPVDYKLGQLTLSDTMKTWAVELLTGYKNIEITTCYVWGALDALKKAKDAIDKKGVAFLLIDSALVGKGIPVHAPTHWIAIANPFKIPAGFQDYITIDCFNWSTLHSIDADLEDVVKNTYSVVAAW